MCAQRRERLWEKWRERGAKVGVREWDVKCAVELEDAVDASGGAGAASATAARAKDVSAKEDQESAD